MKSSSSVKSAQKDDPLSLSDESPPSKKLKRDTSNDPEKADNANSEALLFDLPNDILLKNIIPFIGEYQFHFVGSVNHAMHDAYVKVYPKKETHFATLTKELTKISYEESHRIISLLALYPMLAKKGDLEMLKYLHALDAEVQATKNQEEEAPDRFIRKLLEDFDDKLPVITCDAAAKAGQLHILQWCILEQGFHCEASTCTLAAEHGHFDIVKFCRENDCPWNELTCDVLAETGQLEQLKWCVENGGYCYSSAYTRATRNGHLEILKWLCEKEYSVSVDVCDAAAENGHREVLIWLKLHGISGYYGTYKALAKNGWVPLLDMFEAWPYVHLVCRIGAEHGHIDVLEWCLRNGLDHDEETCTIAARNGFLEIVKFCILRDWPMDEATCAAAAENGHLEILKYCRENDCPWDGQTCAAAALNGHLDVLQWSCENECPWDNRTCTAAAQNGHLDVLQWCHENGCPWNAETCKCAAEHNHLHVLQWCREKNCPWNERECMTLAAQLGHLDVLKWCYENGRRSWYDCPTIAAAYGHLDVVKWIHAHGAPCNEDTYIATVTVGKRPRMEVMCTTMKVILWCLQKGFTGGPKVKALETKFWGSDESDVSFCSDCS